MKLSAQAHFYTVLGVGSDASEAQIKRAYRAAAKSHHPDLPSNRGNAEAARTFKEVKEAYEVLSDPRKRQLYDAFGKKGLSEAYADWQPPTKNKKRRKREHTGFEEPNTEAGSGVASIFEDLFASAVPKPDTKKNDALWSPSNLDMGPVDDDTIPLSRPSERRPPGFAAGNQGKGPRGKGQPGRGGPSAANGGGRFGPGGFSMADLKEGLKAAAGYGGMSEGGGDASDGPMPSWLDGMMGGPVDEEAFGRDRGSSMPRFHQQGDSSGPTPRADKWGPTDDDEWVDGAAGPAGWEEPNPASGWVRDNNAPRREPEPPEDQGPSNSRRARRTVDAEFTPSSGSRERRQRSRENPSRPGDSMHATARIPLLTAIHGGRNTVTLRMPDNSGNWGLEAVEITVPPGLEDGGTLRLTGRGHHGDGGGPRGDLVLTLEIEPHPVFRVEGRDVLVDLPLTPLEAAAGAKIEVPTLYGTAQVKVPPSVSSGAQVRLRGMGLPALDARSNKGDQLLTVQIQLPRRLSRKHLEYLETIEAETGFAPRNGLWDEA
ncbi:MAG: J domain-containing protein [Deltaproteobacteria bacterium]|nr:J domain-containing protein [Deltaproteobacteria bacterium]